MPNYRLHREIYYELSNQINIYADRFVHVADEKFPLPADVVQRMLLSERELALLDELHGMNYVFPRYDKVSLLFTPRMHGVRRAATVIVHNPKGFWFRQKPDNKDFRVAEACPSITSSMIRGVEAEVPSSLRPGIVKWVDNAVASMRRGEVTRTLTGLLTPYDQNKFFPSVGHCAKRWPTLIKLGQRLHNREWSTHFANVPSVNLKIYEWPHKSKERVANIRKMIDIADTVIAGGMMLPPDAQGPQNYEGYVSAWVRDEADWSPVRAMENLRNLGP